MIKHPVKMILTQNIYDKTYYGSEILNLKYEIIYKLDKIK